MTDLETVTQDCVIAGGGPAGMMLGYILSRAGVKTTVLEKHADFFRDFRGDTIHPSTITTLGELALRERFLDLPLSRLQTLDLVVDGQRMTLVDFGHLRKPNDFLVFAPQWDFLNFIADQGRELPTFDLRMQTEARELIVENGVVCGVTATGPDGDIEFRAPLTVAADGRHSTLRDGAAMPSITHGAPIDVLWFSLPRPEKVPPDTLGYFNAGGAVITIPRVDHYQAGTLIKKSGFDELKAEGLPALRKRIVSIAPFLEPVVGTLESWDQVKLLSVRIDRLRQWHRPGFLAIGDAAHAMSPVGGVGVNYAIQDAVAAANMLARDLRAGAAPDRHLAAIQRRREKPVLAMQSFQRIAHTAISRGASGQLAPRWVFSLIKRASPAIRVVTARFVGIGLLPEHVDQRILQYDVDPAAPIG